MHGVTIEEVLRLFPQNSIDLIAGEENLSKRVTGVTLIETPDIVNWVQGGELLLTTGYIYKDNPKMLLELIKELHLKKATALGIKLNRYIQSLPEEISALAGELGFPIFVIVTEHPTFLDIISKVYELLEERKALVSRQAELIDSFLKELLLQDLTTKKNMVIEKALNFNIILEAPKAVFVLTPKKGNIPLTELLNWINLCSQVTGSRLITFYKDDHLALILEATPSYEIEKEVTLKIATSLQKSFADHFTNNKLLIGISRFYSDFFKLSSALLEAEKALVIGTAVWPERTLFHYDDMGFYRLIVNQTTPQELKAFYEEMLGPIVTYDAEYQTELVTTLIAFLEQNGSISLTAQKLYVHYNTVKYRITQIEELLGISLKDADMRFNLQIALKIQPLLI